MRRILAICVILLLPLAMVLADTAQILAQADDLHDKGQYAEAKQAILDALPGAASGAEKAELFWRAARETLELGDKAEEAKQPAAAILKFFEEGEGYANKAIEADPRNDLGYYWKSSNIGRWGQIKGILNSLAKAAPMKELLVKVVGLNPERSDAYYVLGQLYRELPGRPLSFGNSDEAVSLGRTAVDLRERQVQAGTEKAIAYGYYIELAKSLHKRNWSAAARASDKAKKAAKYAAAADPLAKAMAFEATITLPAGSDRDEAKALVQWVIDEVEKIPTPTAGDGKDLVEARKTLGRRLVSRPHPPALFSGDAARRRPRPFSVRRARAHFHRRARAHFHGALARISIRLAFVTASSPIFWRTRKTASSTFFFREKSSVKSSS